MRRHEPRFRTAATTTLLLLAAALVAAADAQPLPSPTRARGTPLPGPAPSAVVRQPPLSLPPAGGVTPSSWDVLREAEAELQRREEDLERCRARLAGVDEDLRRTQEHLGRLEAGMTVLRDEVRRRMVLLDRVGRGGSARLVLTARDPAEARFRSSLIRRLVRADAELAGRYAALQDEAVAIRAELAGKLAGQQALERQLEERRRELADEVDRHRRFLAALERPAAVSALGLEAQGEVQGLARALGLRPAAYDPVAVRDAAAAALDVPASYPVLDDALRGGVIIDVPEGTPVAAPDGGTVAFAGILAGYGPAVVIRTASGDGLLLGHLDALDVVPGEVVSAGTVVGHAAPSFSSLLPGLLVNRVGAPIFES
ncbi:MAG: peptidoglycan DD-metalloendopeptidase family protein [Deltaproteobacteria bacterium]|nr:peptidoglycan DD-metalloendopeptidase family protein [Deltaproteobacteria bacterium]